MTLTLTFSPRRELERRVRTRKARAEDVRRARHSDVGRRRVVRRNRTRAGVPSRLYQPVEAALSSPQAPSDGSTQWITRKLAKVLNVSHMLVARVWGSAGLQPHRFERYMLSEARVRAEGRGRDRALPESAPACGRFCHRPKDGYSSLWIAWTRACRSPSRAERHGFKYFASERSRYSPR
jgi:hypothetical protein